MSKISTRITYQPSIDGLRAVAVLAVIFFHINPLWLPGGFVGVDIFFVISGYLITSIILAELNSNNFSFITFWERRIRRIMPALLVMIILVSLLALFVGLPWLISEIGKEGLTAVFGIGNYRMLSLTSDYWGTHAEHLPMLHTWSLGVEEQFYLFLPLILWTTHRYFRSHVVTVFTILGLASCAWCIYKTSDSQAEAFFLMVPRAWEFLIGALLAFGYSHIGKINSGWLLFMAPMGTLLIFSAFIFAGPSVGFPWPSAILPCLGAALCIAGSTSGDIVTRLLSSNLIVRIGKASYSLYLWHWPALVFGLFLATAFEITALRPICLLVGILIGIGSYVFIEPIGRKKTFLKCWAPALAALAIVLSLWLALSPPQILKGPYIGTKWQGSQYDARAKTKINDVILGDTLSKNLDFVLVGDSHALSLAKVFNEKLTTMKLKGAVFASGGTRITNWKPTRYDMPAQMRAEFEFNRNQEILEHQPKFIVLCARWETYECETGRETISDLIKLFQNLSPQSRIMVISQPPHLDYGDLKAYEWLNWRARLGLQGGLLRIQQNQAFKETHIFLFNICINQTRLEFINLDMLFPAVDGRCDILDSQNNVLYDDDDHLSDYGAGLVIDLLFGVILK